MASPEISPFGSKTRILLTSVFGPYAQDDQYGSRVNNPMELYQNQVTRVQGVFSLRMFHRSFGLMLLQANIEAPCSLLDFPTRDEFIRIIQDNDYDVIGISAIMTNTQKTAEMCRLIRKHQPSAVIVIGGHIANRDGLDRIVDADHIVRGDGVRWFRRYLGQDEEAKVRHPLTYSGHGTRIMGVNLPDRDGATAAMLIPSVGCPVGCNFCSTSAMFGGKGNSINFFQTGDELFEVMSKIESELKVQSFFVMDENFLFHRKRTLRLLELMEESGKSWSMYVFSSAKVIKSYSMEQLIGLGVAWLWLGLEGEDSSYAKLSQVDTRELTSALQDNGIAVLGSSIIGLENHSPDNMDQVIDYAVSHNADFHQFMLYTPIPGTPLYEQHQKEGTLYDESVLAVADTHGQYRFNYRHSHIPPGHEEAILLEAFERDFKINGPSLARLIRTNLNGWLKHKDHPNPRVRARWAEKAWNLRTIHPGAVWAMRKWYRDDKVMEDQLKELLKRFYKEIGWVAAIAAPLIGRYFHMMMKREEQRLARGWTYEPKSFFEKNAQALALDKPTPHPARVRPGKIRWVAPAGAVLPPRQS